MAVYDFFLSRNNTFVTTDTYVGHSGRLFYDDSTGVIRLSDGITPGGIPIPVTLATENIAGAIKLGPGVTLNPEGQLLIDPTGLDFAFGDFYAFTNPGELNGACLSSTNENQNIVIVSNGNGGVKTIGSFAIHKTNETVEGALEIAPVFEVNTDGDISATSLDIHNTGDLGLMAALNVTINDDGLTKFPTVVTGSVAQFTGKDDRAAILVIDSYGYDPTVSASGGSLVFRTGKGTNASTTPVLSGDRLGEITAAGWASNGYGGIGVGGLRIIANENYTATARGSKIELFAIPNGTIVPATIASIDSTGITMSSGKTITGNLIGTASAATSLTAATNILAGTVTINPVNITKGTASTQTFTIASLTTNHKIVVMPQTALQFGIVISAAWASEIDTISIEFQNFKNSNIDLTSKVIQYFAWV